MPENKKGLAVENRRHDAITVATGFLKMLKLALTALETLDCREATSTSPLWDGGWVLLEQVTFFRMRF